MCLPSRKNVKHSGFDPRRHLVLAEVTQHHHARQQQRRRIGQSLARDVRGASVHRLRNRGLPADITVRHNAEAADKSRAQIADDVAIEIRQHHHIQPVRIQDRLQAGVVHDRFVVSDLRKLFGGGAAATANARFTASAISGPIPSPAINVAVCTIP